MECASEMIATQLSEIRALQAIFCADDEFSLHTPDFFFELENSLPAVSKKATPSAKRLEFTLKLKPSDCPGFNSEVFNLHVCLPERYPDEVPLLTVTSKCRHTDRLLEQDLNSFAQDLIGNAMIMQLAMRLQEIRGKYLSTESEHKVDINKCHSEMVETDIRCCLLCIDHMNSKVKYVKTLMSWMKELDINGFLIFYERHRSVNVDVDSNGRPCKERMMTCLWDKHVDTQRFVAFDVIEVSSVEQLADHFSKMGLKTMYHTCVLPLLR